MMNGRWPFSAMVFAVVLWSGLTLSDRAQATSIVARTVPELTSLSSSVVEATVVSQRVWQDASGSIFTRSTLRVHRYLKGQGDTERFVTQRGGVVGDTMERIPGDMALRPGGRVVLFMQRRGGQDWSTLLGWSVFDVHGSGPEARISRQAEHFGLYRPSSEGYHSATPEAMAAPKTLGELSRAVRGVKP